MSDRDTLLRALDPLFAVLRDVDLADPDAAAALGRALPLEGEVLQGIARIFAEARQAGAVCDRAAGEVRFSRVARASAETAGFSIDAVHMSGPGPGHTHGNGEIDLCFPLGGAPSFDGHPPGWVVYPPGSWHVPTVAGGEMDILYFLPGGAITFGPRPG